MSDNRRYLAFDFGASSGRLMLGEYIEGKIKLIEIHRFSNDPVMLNDTFYWDLPRLFYEIKQGLLKSRSYGEISGIGIDTWGVDFGILNKSNKLIGNPVHYRDRRTRSIQKDCFDKVGKEELYSITGNQLMEINSLFQLMALKKYDEDIFSIIGKMVLMPDLFAFLLTGNISSERSIASTTQMYDYINGNWAVKLIEKLGINPDIMPGIVDSGSLKGKLSESICEELGIEPIPVYAVCGHDTQSAMLSVPAKEDKFAFLSCGTWSLLGSETDKPILSEEAMKMDMTNEVGFDGKIAFLKNITGLWLIQESKRQFEKEGKNYSFADIAILAGSANLSGVYIDTDSEEFQSAGNIPKRIRDYCNAHNLGNLNTDGKIFKCIYESLVLKYRSALESLEKLTENKYETLYVIGGGTKDTYFMQMIADGCGIKVSAGPTEATALGNIGVQLIATGVLKDMAEFRSIIRTSENIVEYTPDPDKIKYWDDAYKAYKKIK